MGGNIAIIIRDQEGKEHKMCRWTNPFPDFINNIRFIQANEDYVQNYLQQWYNMVKEYEDHKNGIKVLPKFSPVVSYVTNGGILAPIHYGIVVIDYKTKTILHMQGYGSVGSIDMAQIWLMHDDRMQFIDSKGKETNYAEKWLDDFKKLYDAGLIKSISVWDRDKDPKIQEISFNKENFPKMQTIEGFMKAVDKESGIGQNRKSRLFKVNLNMDPWTVKRFEESKEGLKEIKEAVLELGFKLSQEEEEAWNNFRED